MGIHLDGTRFETRNSLERYGLVRKELCAILGRRKISGWVLEVTVGHCTFYGLVCREALSVSHSVYRFIRKHYYRSAPLWESVREELTAFKGLMIFVINVAAKRGCVCRSSS